MHEWLHNFLWCFIPLFVAIDVFGLLPIYMVMVQDFSQRKRTKVIFNSLTTALIVSTAFILLGNEIFKMLFITVADFQIAGGLVLLTLGILELLGEGKKKRYPEETMGIVPLGVPLIVGPAVLSITLLLLQQFGLSLTIMALLVNLIIVAIVFFYAPVLLNILGRGGSLALSKIFTLLLVAIAVRMIRSGIFQFLNK